MHLTPALALCLVALMPAQEPEAGAVVQELSRLERVWNDAHVRGDAEALDRLWGDDLVVTVPGMAVMTKPETLAVMRSARMRFERYATSDTRIHLHGDTAVVTGRLQRTRTIDGRSVDDDWRFTKVYVRRGGTWLVVAFHASTIAQEPAEQRDGRS